MNFHNYTEGYIRPVAKMGLTQHMRFRNNLRSRNIFELSGGTVLWKAATKVVLLILPVMLVINILVASAINNIDRSFVNIDNQHHQLMDKNIEMLAHKARILAPAQLQKLAEEKLSLYATSEKQVGKFNRRKGTFSY